MQVVILTLVLISVVGLKYPFKRAASVALILYLGVLTVIKFSILLSITLMPSE